MAKKSEFGLVVTIQSDDATRGFVKKLRKRMEKRFGMPVVVLAVGPESGVSIQPIKLG